MESDKINALLEKYFEGETTIAEENELKKYFSSAVVAPHLQQYHSLFGYVAPSVEQTSVKPLVLGSNPRGPILENPVFLLAFLVHCGLILDL